MPDKYEHRIEALQAEIRRFQVNAQHADEEREFTKSLMDDLLEQLAQLQAELDASKAEVDQLNLKIAGYSEENNVLAQKVIDLTQQLERAKET